MTEYDDLKLVEETLKGDKNAFELLIDRYQTHIFNIVLRMVNDFDDAEDITQTVFMKAYLKLKTFDSKYKFFSWIYRMALNESINFLKQRKRLVEPDPDMVMTGKSTDETYDEKEMNVKIEDAIAEFPIDYRAVVIFKYLIDLPYREISQVLDIAEKTVKSRLFTARRLLAELLRKRGVTSYG